MSASSQQFWTNCFLLGVVSVSPVSPVSLAAKGSGVVAVFVWCLWFFGLCFLVALVWLFWCFLFPSLPACLSSFTDWCLVHKQQSREQKRKAHTRKSRRRRAQKERARQEPSSLPTTLITAFADLPLCKPACDLQRSTYDPLRSHLRPTAHLAI